MLPLFSDLYLQKFINLYGPMNQPIQFITYFNGGFVLYSQFAGNSGEYFSILCCGLYFLFRLLTRDMSLFTDIKQKV